MGNDGIEKDFNKEVKSKDDAGEKKQDEISKKQDAEINPSSESKEKSFSEINNKNKADSEDSLKLDKEIKTNDDAEEKETKVIGKDISAESKESEVSDLGDDNKQGDFEKSVDDIKLNTKDSHNNEIVAVETSKSANDKCGQIYNDYDHNPYEKNTTVEKVKITEDNNVHFVRCYNEENGSVTGSWMMNKKDIEGLSSSEIKDKYALEYTPDRVCDVEPDVGSYVNKGKSGKIKDWGNGGGTQYNMVDMNEAKFKNDRKLEDL